MSTSHSAAAAATTTATARTVIAAQIENVPSERRRRKRGLSREGGREEGVDNNQKVQHVVLSKVGKEGEREGGRGSWRESSVFPFPLGLSLAGLFMVTYIKSEECFVCLVLLGHFSRITMKQEEKEREEGRREGGREGGKGGYK